ncbi:MAG TPA: hypothetical protein VMU99_04280 [Acidimicrobiales bacterium]|nr:hypothetical protein [Acidimicrobiales bacterium]
MKIAIAISAVISTGALLTACGSSSTTGSETFSGSTTSTANKPVVPLKASGVFTDTGSITLGGQSTKGTLTFSKGNLDLTHSKGSNSNTPTSFNPSTCRVVFESLGTFKVTGGTGSYKGATGHGTFKVEFAASLPKLANGKCNESNNAQPIAGSSLTTFKATGTLTIT